MSADARIWRHDGLWQGSHDGFCKGIQRHQGSVYELSDVITSIEECMGGRLDWEIYPRPDGLTKWWLRGWQAR